MLDIYESIYKRNICWICRVKHARVTTYPLHISSNWNVTWETPVYHIVISAADLSWIVSAYHVSVKFRNNLWRCLLISNAAQRLHEKNSCATACCCTGFCRFISAKSQLKLFIFHLSFHLCASKSDCSHFPTGIFIYRLVLVHLVYRKWNQTAWTVSRN
jgi:hypothetical protein